MSKILKAICILLITANANAQRNEKSIGISVGLTNYIPRPEFISARADFGYSAGFVSAFGVTQNSDIVLEIGFARFGMDFKGKPIGPTQEKWLDFRNNRAYLSVLYYQDIISVKDKGIVFGVHAGPTANYVNNFVIKGKDNAGYTLAPYEINALTMKISHYHDNAAWNFFASAGINVFYKCVEANLRYNLGLTSPYTKLQGEDHLIDFSGKDDYISLSFNIYLNGL